jgi:membrane fusion protein (multidrug efflux system)
MSGLIFNFRIRLVIISSFQIMKKKTKIILYGTLAIVLSAIFIIPRIGSPDRESAGNKRSTGQSANTSFSVKGLIVSMQDISNEISSIGTALASEEVEIKSETTGRVTNISFKEGSFVSKGQLLVKINDSELQAQLSKAKSRLKLLQDREERQRVLYEKQLSSKEDYDVALNELNALRSDIELLNVQISKTEIRAPFSGKIGIRNISEGAYVSPSTVIANLQNLSQIKIDFTIPEKYATLIKQNDNIKFRPVNEKEYLNGKVYAIEPKINRATRTILVRGIYSNAGNKVIPGSFLDVKLELQKIKNAVLIPSYALIHDIKGEMIFQYKGGRAIQQMVETALRTESNVQVTSGIKPGDTIITSGILQLKNNIKVNISSLE